jgi:hypothetical protein
VDVGDRFVEMELLLTGPEADCGDVSNHAHVGRTRLLTFLPSDRAHEKLPVEIGTGNIERRSYVP